MRADCGPAEVAALGLAFVLSLFLLVLAVLELSR